MTCLRRRHQALKQTKPEAQNHWTEVLCEMVVERKSEDVAGAGMKQGRDRAEVVCAADAGDL